LILFSSLKTIDVFTPILCTTLTPKKWHIDYQ
jgi:hypothetical protein